MPASARSLTTCKSRDFIDDESFEKPCAKRGRRPASVRAAHLFPVPPTWLKPADMSMTYSAPSIRSFPDKPHCSVVRKEPRIVLRRSRAAPLGGCGLSPGAPPYLVGKP